MLDSAHLAYTAAVQAQRHTEGLRRSAPQAAAALISRAFLTEQQPQQQPSETSGPQSRLISPAARGQVLMKALASADSNHVRTGLLAAANSQQGLGTAVRAALQQVRLISAPAAQQPGCACVLLSCRGVQRLQQYLHICQHKHALRARPVGFVCMCSSC